jgi:hypothetical protein
VQVEDAAREEVSRAIVQAGLGLLAMQGESSGLEAVFLQLSNSEATRRPASLSANPSPDQKDLVQEAGP